MSYKNTWKNKEVFLDQLALNEKELNQYPYHWNCFLSLLEKISPQSILDLGCGCGVFFELCRRHFPNIQYTGVDYAEEAITIAKEKWKQGKWEVKDYTDLTEDNTKDYDVLHAGALLDVLEDGHGAYCYLLGLKFKSIILGRVKLTKEDSYFNVYTAYDKIQTYEYYHNVSNLVQEAENNNYELMFIGEETNCTLLLTKK